MARRGVEIERLLAADARLAREIDVRRSLETQLSVVNEGYDAQIKAAGKDVEGFRAKHKKSMDDATAKLTQLERHEIFIGPRKYLDPDVSDSLTHQNLPQQCHC